MTATHEREDADAAAPTSWRDRTAQRRRSHSTAGPHGPRAADRRRSPSTVDTLVTVIDLGSARRPRPRPRQPDARGDDPGLVDAVLAADARRRSALTSFETLRAEQKALGKQVAAGAGRREGRRCCAAPRQLAEQVKAPQADADAASGRARPSCAGGSPNIVVDGVPAGGEDDYVVLQAGRRRGATSPPRASPMRDHLELGERLARDRHGARRQGLRLAVLLPHRRRRPARARAAQGWRWTRPLAAGFTPMITPTLVRPRSWPAPASSAPTRTRSTACEADDLYLVGTSEVALAGYHADEILDLAAGRMRYAGWSACYRREAGSHGKDIRGIIRVHQFHKVEMFSYVPVEDAAAEHERLLAWEEQMLAAVELPYRVIDTAAGDLGSSAARKFDCEAWLPSQQRCLELTSTSNCTTFQARRLGVRERTADGDTRPVATLNGTLGHHALDRRDPGEPPAGRRQRARPEALRPYLGGLEILEPPWLMTRRLRWSRSTSTARWSTYDEPVSRGCARRSPPCATPGHHVVLATGRVGACAPAGRGGARADRGLGRLLNGAVTVVLDPAAGGYEMYRVVTFDPGPAAAPARAELPDALFAVEDSGVGSRVPPPFPEGELSAHQVVVLRGAASTPATRVVVRSPEQHPRGVPRAGRAIGPARRRPTPSAGPPGSTSTPRASPRRARWRRCGSELGVAPHRTLAVGDGSNDIEMLRWAARGVAMGHAPTRSGRRPTRSPARRHDGLVAVLRAARLTDGRRSVPPARPSDGVSVRRSRFVHVAV